MLPIGVVINMFRLTNNISSAGDGKQPVACLKRVSDRWEDQKVE